MPEAADPPETAASGEDPFGPGAWMNPRYVVIDEIGCGGSGRVLSACDVLFDREVAIKLGVAAGEAAAERLLREARITARIEHSNVVPVFDLERRHDGTTFFTMRRVIGISLAEAIARRARGEPLPEAADNNDLVTIVRKACDAVGSAHEQGLVHTDLKPDNIMLGRHGEVFVIDWGEASELGARSARGNEVRGTPAYMAPEQARGGEVSPASDVYALAASLFHAIYGRVPLPPRHGETLTDLLARRAGGELQPPDTSESTRAPLPLQAILLRALAADPAMRPSDAEAFGRDLADFQSGRLETWEEIVHLRFDRDGQIDARFMPLWRLEDAGPCLPCPERVEIRRGRLVFEPFPNRSFLRWSTELAEEARLEVEVDVPAGGTNLDLCVCGDPSSGYRLRVFGTDHVAIESVRSGRYLILARRDGVLPCGRRVHLAIGHAGNRVWAELDGRTILECCDAMPPRGAEHRTAAVGRMSAAFTCEILSLRLWSRRPPLVVGSLDVGKQLLRAGHADDAAAWFRTCQHREQPPAVQHEAAYLAALATTGDGRSAALRQVAAEAANPFHRQAQQLLAQELAEAGDPAEAVTALLVAEREAADPGMSGRIASLLISRLHREAAAEKPALLAALARIPVRRLDIGGIGIAELAPLAGMQLACLHASGNRISDIAPLAGMPLSELDLSHNLVHDPAALGSLPLRTLSLRSNPCRRLPLLGGARLEILDIAGTGVDDLSVLAGHPLRRIDLGSTPVVDLRPLAGAPLSELIASGCRIVDLSPLAGAPLTSVLIAGSSVIDPGPILGPALRDLDLGDCPLRSAPPLAGSAVARLHLGGTPIADLAPLAGSRIRILEMERMRPLDLAPLAGLPLQELAIDGHVHDWLPLAGLPIHSLRVRGPVSGSALAVAATMPLHSLVADLAEASAWPLIASCSGLRLCNGLEAGFVRRLAPDLQRFLAGDPAGDLRRHAVEAGGRHLLPLPLRMRRPQAQALAARTGAVLMCVPDARRRHQALRALLPIAADHLACSQFHCGLDVDGDRVRWADGTPADEEQERLAGALASGQHIPVVGLYRSPYAFPADHVTLAVLEWI